jgi:O-antigen/teichoic acid export membrane protein
LSLQNSKDTVITNLTQQGVSIIIFLLLPNLLTVDGYAQITYVAVLLSFMMLSDIGVTSVYNRKMPAVYYSGNVDEMNDWNTTVFWFRFFTSLGFAVVISAVYFNKHNNIINSLILAMVVPLLTIASFYISKYTVQSDFSVYRRINSFQAYTKLLVLPFTYLFGLTGWFISQSVSGIFALFAIKGKIFPDKCYINTHLIKPHLIEGLLLVATTFMWTQLLGSARFFSSFYYPNVVTAQYGLINSGYQIISSLVIAAFLPVTVYLLKFIKTDEEQAVDYVFNKIIKSIPVVFVLTAVSAEITPFLLIKFFPKYNIDSLTAKVLIFSLITYPILVIIGNLFIGKKKTLHYLVLTASFFCFNWLLVLFLKPYYGFQAASIAQFISITIYTFCELMLAFYLFGPLIKRKCLKFIYIYGELLFFTLIYLGFKKIVY